jgi:NifB/MoaA-like Fe-S oxidoreductase
MLEDARTHSRERLQDFETRMVTKEILASELRRVYDHFDDAVQDVEKRLDIIEVQKHDSREFRRNMSIAVITVALTAMASLILALLHFA